MDEFLICYWAKHMCTIEKQLNICLDKLQKWCDRGFKFSKTKTECMHFYQLRKLHQDPSLFLMENNFQYANAKKSTEYTPGRFTLWRVQTVRFYSDYTELWSGPSWIILWFNCIWLN